MATVALILLLASTLYSCFNINSRWPVLFGGLAFAGVALVQKDASTALLTIGLFTTLFTAQVVLPLIVDGIRTFIGIDTKIRFRIFAKTLYLSTPMIAIAGAGALATNHALQVFVVNPAYAIETNQEWGCDTSDSEKPRLICKQGGGLEHDINATLIRLLRKVKQNIRDNLESSVKNATTETSDQIGVLTEAMFSGDPPSIPRNLSEVSPSLGYLDKKCRFYHWFYRTEDCARKLVMEPIDLAYRDVRNELEQAWRHKSKQAFIRSANNGQSLIAYSESFLDHHFEIAETRALSTNKAVFVGLRLWDLITFLVVVTVITKYTLIILGRQLFDPKVGNLPLKFSRTRDSNNSIECHDITTALKDAGGSEVGFSLSLNGHTWYAGTPSFLSAGRLTKNRLGRLTLPNPFSLTLARLLAGKLMFSVYSESDGYSDFGYHGAHNYRFMHLKIPEGKRVVVRLNNLLAYTKGLSLYSVFDVRLPLLLRRGFFLRIVEGPGEMILAGDGGSVRVMTPDGGGTEPIDVIAFDLDGSFALDVEHDMLTTYFSGYSVLPTGNSFAVREAPTTLIQSSSQLIYKAIFLLFPL